MTSEVNITNDFRMLTSSENLCHCSHSLGFVREATYLKVFHSRLTHTDLKPENILFCSSDWEISYNARKVG